MRLLVCGGRAYPHRDRVFEVLDALHAEMPVSVLINGGADGADRYAREWAQERNVPISLFEAQWKRFGPSAGPRRNTVMLYEGRPELVVAFPGGRGTRDMTTKATVAGIPIRKVLL
jgi:hypothetical protein